jgi:Fe-S cluster biogenesis protein NfuA
MIRPQLRLVPVSAIILQSFLGLVLLNCGGGCGGDTSAPMTEANKQNIQDELNAADAAKKTKKAGQP